MAVVLIAGASAFVKSNNHSPAALYHWYSVNAAGNVVSGSDVFGGVTKDQTYANGHSPCPTGTNSDCIRGFLSVPAFPTSATGDATPIMKP